MLSAIAQTPRLTAIRQRLEFAIVLALVGLTGACARLDANTPDWTEFSRRVDVDAGVSLYHERYGSGPPMLFIHGLGSSRYTWRHLVTPLSVSANVILLDLKGFGDSPKPKDKEYSLYDQARLVYQFIAKHDLRDLTLVGNSYGGGVALVTSLYLHQHSPGRLRRLVLISSIGYPQALPRPIKILTTPLLGSALVSLIPKKQQVRSMLKIGYYDDRKIPADAIEAYSQPLHAPGAKHALLQTARQIIPSDLDLLTKSYVHLTVPTLIIWGANDQMVPLSVGLRMSRDIPETTFAVIEESGHIPQEEKPAETLRLIVDFLAST